MSRICLVPCLLIAAVCVTFPQMADAACNSVTQYQCDSGRCIPLYWRCDTILNCDDGDDEQGCDTATCLSPYFPYRCPSGKCIAESWVCDLYFRIDCPDGADQKNCANIDCTEPYVWQCADTVCIMKDKKCNGNVDCPDESDEAGCDTPNCAEDEFTCNSGACIASDKVCDQVADCPGKQQEDEENCSGPRTCDEFSFRCNNGVCILRNLQCDTVEHCKDGEDEECGSYCHQCDGWYDTDHQCHPDSYTYPIESACDKGKICSSTLKKNAQGELRYNVGCKGKSYCNNLQSENPAACSSDPSSIGADEKCTFCCEANLCNRYDSLPSPPTEVTTTAATAGLQCVVCDKWYKAQTSCGSNVETCGDKEQCATTYKLNANGKLVYTASCKSNFYCRGAHTEAMDCDLSQQDKCIFCCTDDNCNAYDENPPVITG